MFFFFFNDTATTEISTLSLHDALPILLRQQERVAARHDQSVAVQRLHPEPRARLKCERRSEEHTSELQSRQYLVCRLLLEKKTNKTTTNQIFILVLLTHNRIIVICMRC